MSVAQHRAIVRPLAELRAGARQLAAREFGPRVNVKGDAEFVALGEEFNRMAKEVPAFNGLTWAGLGDSGATVPI